MIEDNNNAKVIAGIRHVIAEMMDSVLNKVLVTDPFIPEQHHAKKPLYAAFSSG